jgi:PAS domain S-box-containing protein
MIQLFLNWRDNLFLWLLIISAGLLLPIHYLVFHTYIELISIIIGITITAMTWFTYRFSHNHFLMWLGCGYFWVAMLDLIHCLTYSGMPDLFGASVNHATQFWIAGRMMETAILLSAPYFVKRTVQKIPIFISFGIITILTILLIFYDLFPACYIPGQGLTPFKIMMEYSIIILLGLVFYRLRVNQQHSYSIQNNYIAIAVFSTASAELLFTLYKDPYGLFNYLGHVCKLISYWYLFAAAVRLPMQILLTTAEQNQTHAKQLRDSELRYRQLFENNHAVQLLIDPRQGTILDANYAAELFYGYPRTTLTNMHISDINILKPTAIKTHMSKAQYQTHRPFNFRHRLASGEIRDVEVYSGPVTLGNRTVLYSFIHDITDRQRTEAALQKSQARYQSLVENIGTNFVIYSRRLDGTLEFVSQGIEQVFNISVTAAIGQNLFHLITWTPESLQKIHKNTKKLQQQKGSISQELCFQRFDSSIGTVIINSHLTNDMHDQDQRIEGIIEDITQRKYAEQALIASEQRLRRLGDNLPRGVIFQQVYSPDGLFQFTYISAGIQELLGLTPTQVLTDAQAALALIDRDDLPRMRRASSKSLVTMTAFDQVLRYHTLSGTRCWLHIRFQPYMNDDGRIWTDGFAIDITTQKQAELALIEAREAAEAANHAKSAFLANMSHELRTPLNAILGFSQITLQMVTLPKKAHNYVKKIQRSGEYLLTLLNDILDVSKVEAGRIELYPEEVDVHSFFSEVIDIFDFQIKQKGLMFHYHIDSSVPECLYIDPKRLRQIILNLIGNAVKFTESGYVSLQVSHHAQTILQLDISDSGTGIANEQLNEIFKPFAQVGADHYKIHGTGLGLTITRKMIDLMHGTIDVHSQLGQGSQFHVHIPLELPCHAHTLPKQANPKPLQTKQTPIVGYQRLDGLTDPIRILIVDDIADNREVLSQQLQALRFVVQEADSGAQCLEVAPHYQPHIIFMDMRMPNGNGLETMQALQHLPNCATIPIVIVSASAFDEDRQAALQAGCVDYIAKPVSESRLLTVLQRTLSLQWHYAESVNQPIDGQQHASLLALSETWLTALAHAVTCGDRQHIHDLILEAEQQGHQLPEQVHMWIDHYDYQHILSWINQLNHKRVDNGTT